MQYIRKRLNVSSIEKADAPDVDSGHLLFAVFRFQILLCFAQKHTVIIEGFSGGLLEAVEEIGNSHVGTLFAGDVQNDLTGVHHDGAVAELQCGLHIVRNHHTREVVFLHGVFRDLEHLFGGGGVKRGGMLIEQKELRRVICGHHKRERLALAAGKQTHGLGHAVFEPHTEQGEAFAKHLSVLAGDRAEPTAVPRCEREVFFDGHARCAAAHGVLKQAADAAGTLILRHEGDVLAVKLDLAAVREKAAGNSVEERGFARAVCADDGDEIALCGVEAEVFDRLFGVDRAGVEGLRDMREFKHGCAPFRNGASDTEAVF